MGTLLFKVNYRYKLILLLTLKQVKKLNLKGKN